MHPIYHSHYGLVREPFSVTPDPTFLYLSPSHREALAQLLYGIKERKGFVVLTGEIGTGKTTLIHTLLKALDGATHTAFVFNSILSPKDLLRYVCADFGLQASHEQPAETYDYVSLLHRFLLDSYQKGENVTIILDEAQNLSTEVLESVRLLSNFETSQDKLLQILLVGQPELDVRLNSPELRQLKQRISLRYHLRPLDLTECREYVARRLEIAGGSSTIFTSKSLEAVYLYSGGTPRLINILCDSGMLTAYGSRKGKIDEQMIQEMAGDLNLTEQLAMTKSHSPTLGWRSEGHSNAPSGKKRMTMAHLVVFVSVVIVSGGYLAMQWTGLSLFALELLNTIVQTFRGSGL